MTFTVTAFDDAGAVLDLAGGFLADRPVENNLVLSLLGARAGDASESATSEPGHYWVATGDSGGADVVFHSPARYRMLLSAMAPEAAVALASAIAESGAAPPGVGGEAAAASAFAGAWLEGRGQGARPTHALRLYEIESPTQPMVPGRLRRAEQAERDLLVDWLRVMRDDVPPPGPDPVSEVDGGLAGSRLWVWDDSGPVSVAAETSPAEGVVRIKAVFTPPEHRRRGYAAAVVEALSRRILAGRNRCILYADLANPVSNSVYRRVGYRAVTEILSYEFVRYRGS